MAKNRCYDFDMYYLLDFSMELVQLGAQIHRQYIFPTWLFTECTCGICWYSKSPALLLMLFSFLSSVHLFFNPKDCGPPGSFVHGTSQTRILEWVAISFPNSGIKPEPSCIAARFFNAKSQAKPKSLTQEPSNCELSKMQRCVCVSRQVKLAHRSGVHCHICASCTNGCAFVYFTVQSTIVWYLHFKPRMSGRKHKSSGDVAGTAKKCRCCTVLVYLPRYCNVRSKMFSLSFVFVLYVLFV